jgi:hypothetical protein
MTVITTKSEEQTWDIMFLVHSYGLCQHFVTVTNAHFNITELLFIFINSVISTKNFTSSSIITHNVLQDYYSRIKRSWSLKSKYILSTRSKTCKDASRPVDDERHLSPWELTSSCWSANTPSNWIYMQENRKCHDNEYVHWNKNVGNVRTVEWKSEILTQVTQR